MENIQLVMMIGGGEEKEEEEREEEGEGAPLLSKHTPRLVL